MSNNVTRDLYITNFQGIQTKKFTSKNIVDIISLFIPQFPHSCFLKKNLFRTTLILVISLSCYNHRFGKNIPLYNLLI